MLAKKNRALYSLVLQLTLGAESFASNAVTYTLSKGRFGDHILAYCEARWISYVYGIEFYYKPFRYSDQLRMHEIHKQVKDHTQKNELEISDGQQLFREDRDTLFVTVPFPTHNPVNFSDAAFIKLLQDEMRPLKALAKVEIPKNHISIAMHVRRGGGWDLQLCQSDTVVTAGFVPKKPEMYSHRCADHEYPTRFPPDSFYIEQLTYVISLFKDQAVYVHIFTDDPQPELIARKYEEALGNNPRVVFGYRKSDNKHDSNVLEDFFSMMEFDCLIRAGSNYSSTAGDLGRIKLEIRPSEYVWEGSKLIITEVAIFERENEPGKLKTTKRYMKSG